MALPTPHLFVDGPLKMPQINGAKVQTAVIVDVV